jgi:hypothetical protein
MLKGVKMLQVLLFINLIVLIYKDLLVEQILVKENSIIVVFDRDIDKDKVLIIPDIYILNTFAIYVEKVSKFVKEKFDELDEDIKNDFIENNSNKNDSGESIPISIFRYYIRNQQLIGGYTNKVKIVKKIKKYNK